MSIERETGVMADPVHDEAVRVGLLGCGHVGSALVRGALDIIRARNEKVQPRCPFVSAFIRKNPQYRDLLAG